MPFTIDINPIVTTVGPIPLRWYSLVLVFAAVVATAVFLREARRLDFESPVLMDGIVWVAIAAIVGGRILFELQNELPHLAADPFHLLMVWDGGLSFYGGLIAAVIAIVAFARTHGIPIWPALDAAAPAAAIGQAIGHVGCLITGDSFGLPTSLPWAVIYRNPAAMAPLNVSLQPTQAYEAIALGLLFAGLWLGRRRLTGFGPGAVAGTYLIGLAAIRFALFYLRDEQSVFLGFKTAQLIGIGIAIAGLVMLARLFGRQVGARSNLQKEIVAP